MQRYRDMSNVETRPQKTQSQETQSQETQRQGLNPMKKVPLGVIFISVIMFFMAAATVFFWIARLVGKASPPPVPIDPVVFDSFAAPDIILSIFLFIGSYGLIKLRKFGFAASLIAMGMLIFDTLLVLGITMLTHINITGPSLLFAFFTVVYLWIKKELFD